MVGVGRSERDRELGARGGREPGGPPDHAKPSGAPVDAAQDELVRPGEGPGDSADDRLRRLAVLNLQPASTARQVPVRRSLGHDALDALGRQGLEPQPRLAGVGGVRTRDDQRGRRCVGQQLLQDLAPLGQRPIPQIPVGAEYCVISCDLGVFVEEAAEPVSSDDLDVGVDGIRQRPQRAGLFHTTAKKYIRVSVIVSTLKKSQANIPAAWALRN
jgi:hypothetical protein